MMAILTSPSQAPQAQAQKGLHFGGSRGPTFVYSNGAQMLASSVV